MINNCSFSGYVQNKSELTQTGERAFIRFCIGIPRRYKNKEGKRDYDFIDAVSFGAQAKFVDEYFNIGSPVCVTGEMKTDLYTDQTGKAKSHTVLSPIPSGSRRMSFGEMSVLHTITINISRYPAITLRIMNLLNMATMMICRFDAKKKSKLRKVLNMQKSSTLSNINLDENIHFKDIEISKVDGLDTYDELNTDDIFDYLSFTATKIS